MDLTHQPFNYSTIDDISSCIIPGCYLATVDISSAYRAVPISPDQWTYQGINWPLDGIDTLLKDTRLCFGLRCAPFIFSTISDFVVRCMNCLGYPHVINYLDDFSCFGSSFEECQQAQMVLISVLGHLGFSVSWKKCASPSTCVRYLGIDFDTVSMTLSLPKDKLEKLREELEFFRNRTRATTKQFQRLCGIVAHCANVIHGGRTFSRRIIDLLKGLPENNKRIRLSAEFQLDLRWWLNFSLIFNGKEYIIVSNFGKGPVVDTDASFAGYGKVCGHDWQAGYFDSGLRPSELHLDPYHNHWPNVEMTDSKNIDYLELVPVFLALQSYQHDWANHHVLFKTDNTQVLSMVNKGLSVNKECMAILREIFWVCAKKNIYISAVHIPGEFNHVPDLLSRIKSSNALSKIENLSLCCSGCGITG